MRMGSSGGGEIQITPATYTPLPASSMSLDTSTTPVTTAAYVSLGTAVDAIKEVEFINKTNVVLILAFGPPSSEVPQCYISPDGLSRQAFNIPIGTELSVKAVQTDADMGLILLNAFG